MKFVDFDDVIFCSGHHSDSEIKEITQEIAEEYAAIYDCSFMIREEIFSNYSDGQKRQRVYYTKKVSGIL